MDSGWTLFIVCTAALLLAAVTGILVGFLAPKDPYIKPRKANGVGADGRRVAVAEDSADAKLFVALQQDGEAGDTALHVLANASVADSVSFIRVRAGPSGAVRVVTNTRFYADMVGDPATWVDMTNFVGVVDLNADGSLLVRVDGDNVVVHDPHQEGVPVVQNIDMPRIVKRVLCHSTDPNMALVVTAATGTAVQLHVVNLRSAELLVSYTPQLVDAHWSGDVVAVLRDDDHRVDMLALADLLTAGDDAEPIRSALATELADGVNRIFVGGSSLGRCLVAATDTALAILQHDGQTWNELQSYLRTGDADGPDPLEVVPAGRLLVMALGGNSLVLFAPDSPALKTEPTLSVPCRAVHTYLDIKKHQYVVGIGSDSDISVFRRPMLHR